jgi:hypothetical protein
MTPLMAAAEWSTQPDGVDALRRDEMIRILLEHGADPLLRDWRGMAALTNPLR